MTGKLAYSSTVIMAYISTSLNRPEEFYRVGACLDATDLHVEPPSNVINTGGRRSS